MGSELVSAKRYLLEGAIGGACWAFLGHVIVVTLRIAPGNGAEGLIYGVLFWPVFTTVSLYSLSQTGMTLVACCPVRSFVSYFAFAGLVGALSGLSASILALAVVRFRSRIGLDWEPVRAKRYLLRGAVGGVCWAYIAQAIVLVLRVAPGNGFEGPMYGVLFWPVFATISVYSSSFTSRTLEECCPVRNLVTFYAFEGLVGLLSGLSLGALALVVVWLRSRLFRVADGGTP